MKREQNERSNSSVAVCRARNFMRFWMSAAERAVTREPFQEEATPFLVLIAILERLRKRES